MLNYHVIMLSGGQLRHYEVSTESFEHAYAAAQRMDADTYTNSYTVCPDATVIGPDGNARNYYHA